MQIRAHGHGDPIERKGNVVIQCSVIVFLNLALLPMTVLTGTCVIHRSGIRCLTTGHSSIYFHNKDLSVSPNARHFLDGSIQWNNHSRPEIPSLG